MPDHVDAQLREIAHALVADAPEPPASLPAREASPIRRRPAPRVAASVLALAVVVVVGMTLSVTSRDKARDRTVRADQPDTSGQAPTTAAGGAAPPAAHACPSASGTATDVATEPPWRSATPYRDWTTKDGCLVRIDILADRAGPAHCGWDAARVIVSGRPVGARYTSDSDSVTFVRDPSGVFGRPELASGFDAHAALPAAAADTGFRLGAVELWTVPGDASAVYLKAADGVEKWPAGETPLCR